MVVVKDQAQAAKDDNVGVGLDADPREQLIERFAGDRKDRDLLAFHQAIEHVDHRHAGLDHVVRQIARDRIDRRTTDVDAGIVEQLRAAVDRFRRPVEHTPQDVRGIGNAKRMTQETDAGLRRQPFAAGEHLQRDGIILQFDDLGQRRRSVPVLDHGQITEANVTRPNAENVSDDAEHFGVVR